MRSLKSLIFLLTLLIPFMLSCHPKTVIVVDPTSAEPFFYEFKGAVDETVWEKLRYTFEGNSCVNDPRDVEGGLDQMSLWVRKLEVPRENRNYEAGGVATRRYFTYGTFTVKMRVPIPSGTVGSFFLMNRWQPGHWLHKEIDYEFLGKSRHAVQTNIHRFWADTESAAGKPFVWDSPFDYGADFHEYSIVWKPDSVEWKVDGQTVYKTTENSPDEPMNILVNFWVPDPKMSWTSNWVGPFDEKDLPVKVEYKWVKYKSL